MYANPDDVPALVNILRDLMNDPQKRSQMSVAGYQQARKFDAEIIRKKRQLLHEKIVKAWPQKENKRHTFKVWFPYQVSTRKLAKLLSCQSLVVQLL